MISTSIEPRAATGPRHSELVSGQMTCHRIRSESLFPDPAGPADSPAGRLVRPSELDHAPRPEAHRRCASDSYRDMAVPCPFPCSQYVSLRMNENRMG